MTEEYNRQEELKALDNTKEGVKGLVDSGITRIPNIFVRPQDELLQEKSSSITNENKNNVVNLHVPVIDLAVKDKDEIVKQVKDASEKWGFFQIVNHGIPFNVLNKMIKSVKMFHEQDVEVRKEFYTRDICKQVVYNTNYDLYQSKAANWRDTLTISSPLDGHDLDPQLLPEICREAVMDYINHIMKLGDILLELLSLALGLKPDYLKQTECHKGWHCACHYYPSCPEPSLTLGSSQHTDPLFLTVIMQDQIGGLQVLHQNQWVDIEPNPNALVVNIADILQMMSNDKFKSVCHRVKANEIGPRISVAFFFSSGLASTRVYGPIKELLSDDNPPVYREFTVGEYVTHSFDQRALGESGVHDFKILRNQHK